MSPHDRRKRFLTLAAAVATPMLFSGGGSVGTASEFDEALSLAPPPRSSAEPDPGLFIPDQPILIQALVEEVSRDATGSVIATIGPAWHALLDALAKDPDALRNLSPRQVEELVAASYEKAGFDDVILTPRSGDHGRDVIAVKRGFCTVRIIDQVKHFAPHHRVSANDVRALVGVLLSDTRATKGFVTTTSTFAPGIYTDPFISIHVPYRLELVDGKSLLSRLLPGTAGSVQA